MGGIFFNPFIEGLITVTLGVLTIIAGIHFNAAELKDVGKTVIGIGLGYFVHSAVVKPVP